MTTEVTMTYWGPVWLGNCWASQQHTHTFSSEAKAREYLVCNRWANLHAPWSIKPKRGAA